MPYLRPTLISLLESINEFGNFPLSFNHTYTYNSGDPENPCLNAPPCPPTHITNIGEIRCQVPTPDGLGGCTCQPVLPEPDSLDIPPCYENNAHCNLIVERSDVPSLFTQDGRFLCIRNPEDCSKDCFCAIPPPPPNCQDGCAPHLSTRHCSWSCVCTPEVPPCACTISKKDSFCQQCRRGCNFEANCMEDRCNQIGQACNLDRASPSDTRPECPPCSTLVAYDCNVDIQTCPKQYRVSDTHLYGVELPSCDDQIAEPCYACLRTEPCCGGCCGGNCPPPNPSGGPTPNTPDPDPSSPEPQPTILPPPPPSFDEPPADGHECDWIGIGGRTCGECEICDVGEFETRGTGRRRCIPLSPFNCSECTVPCGDCLQSCCDPEPCPQCHERNFIRYGDCVCRPQSSAIPDADALKECNENCGNYVFDERRCFWRCEIDLEPCPPCSERKPKEYGHCNCVDITGTKTECDPCQTLECNNCKNPSPCPPCFERDYDTYNDCECHRVGVNIPECNACQDLFCDPTNCSRCVCVSKPPPPPCMECDPDTGLRSTQQTCGECEEPDGNCGCRPAVPNCFTIDCQKAVMKDGSCVCESSCTSPNTSCCAGACYNPTCRGCNPQGEITFDDLDQPSCTEYDEDTCAVVPKQSFGTFTTSGISVRACGTTRTQSGVSIRCDGVNFVRSGGSVGLAFINRIYTRSGVTYEDWRGVCFSYGIHPQTGQQIITSLSSSTRCGDCSGNCDPPTSRCPNVGHSDRVACPSCP